MKRITIVNGIGDDSHKAFESGLSQTLSKYGDNILCEVFNVRDMNIKYCSGCWGCWVRTPGRCIYADDMPAILQSIMQSDLTVFVSPVVMGFVSANIKKVNDRMLPLIHPYVGIFNQECHHVKRYIKYPKYGLILLGKEQENSESLDIITSICKRLAINLKSELAFSFLTDESIEEVEYALNHF